MVDRISAVLGGIGAAQENRGTAQEGAGGFSEVLQAAQGQTKTMDQMFAQAAQSYQVPEELLRAVAYHESRYQPEVVSRCGAMGVMQLMPATAKAMGVTDAFDPEQNIMGGAKLLSQLYNQYDGDLKLTLAAYGAGSGSVAKYGGVPPFEETQNFVTDIMEELRSANPEYRTISTSTAYGVSGAGMAAEAQKTQDQTYAFRTLEEGQDSLEGYDHGQTARRTRLLQEIAAFSGYSLDDYQLFLSLILQDEASYDTSNQGGGLGYWPMFL